MDWHKQAACYKREDINWDADELTYKHAVFCAPCEVREICFQQAIRRENRCDPGIWGGTTEVQRRAIRQAKENGAALLQQFWIELELAAQ